MIKVITGVRRCGKSSLMEMVRDEIIANGTDPGNIVFIHLDKRPYKSSDILPPPSQALRGEDFFEITLKKILSKMVFHFNAHRLKPYKQPRVHFLFVQNQLRFE